MATKKKATAAVALTIEPLKMVEVGLCILGATPLIFNKKSSRTRQTLILPDAPKNQAAKRATLKHDPLREFRESVYTDPAEDAPARLAFPSPGFKGAAMTAALEIPGATKASVGRLIQVLGYRTHIWGVPQLMMADVKQAGIARSPDVRTRAILPEWATKLVIRYPASTLDPSSIANLFAAGGQICGVGDWRQEKGKGNFGLYSLVNEDDADYQRIIAEQGREPQQAALNNPEAYDEETGDLWSWYEEEIIARGREGEVAHVVA